MCAPSMCAGRDCAPGETGRHVKGKWLTPPAPADKLGTPGSDGAEVIAMTTVQAAAARRVSYQLERLGLIEARVAPRYREIGLLD